MIQSRISEDEKWPRISRPPASAGVQAQSSRLSQAEACEFLCRLKPGALLIPMVWYNSHMQETPELPPIPSIPFDPNAINWAEIVGIAGGTAIVIIIALIVFQWIRYRHEIAKRKLELEASQVRPQIQPGADQAQVQRLQERLENLELLIVRLDREMNQQWERTLLGKSGGLSGEQGGVSQMPTAMMNMISSLEGRYQVLKELGRGGMGIVFQAHDKQLNEQVALKIISPMLSNDPESLERLKREVSSARRIAHPNIIRID